MGIAYNPKIVTNGLVLCLDAVNDKSYPGSGTTWRDLSGNGNNGSMGSYNTLQTVTVGGVTAKTIISSKTSAATSYTTVSNSASITIRNNFSFMCVCYKTSDLQRQTIVGKTLNTPWDGFYINVSRDGNGQLCWWSGSSYGGWWDTGLTVPTNKFTFIAGNWTGSTRKAWLAHSDLPLTSVSNNLSTWNSPTDNADLGIFTEIWQPTSSTYTLDGGISYLSIYNSFLTDIEIQQNYSALRGRFGI